MEKRKILVVDDETSIRQLIRSMLREDFAIVTAANGEEAIESAHTEKPDLILMDITMPKVDGYAACSILKTDGQTRAIPVIMLTGVGYELNKQLARQAGAEAFLTKPFALQDLRRAISEVLGT